jgi:Smg protein
MFAILVYLFENCRQADVAQNSELVAKKLSAAGFDDSDISETLAWLAGVLEAPHRAGAPLPDASRAMRVFAPRECAKLDAECLGFLMHLERSEVLDPGMRELVLDRVLAASTNALSLDQLKLIVLMILWNQQAPTSRLIAEDLLSTDTQHQSH